MATVNEVPQGQADREKTVPDDRDPDAPRDRPGHSTRYWLIFLSLVVFAIIGVLVLGWLPRHRRTQAIDRETKQRTQGPLRVAAQKVKRAPGTSELAIPGTTLPDAEAHIYARASGYITRRLVDIGDHVRAGQLLATIDSPELDRQVAQAQAAVQQSEASLGQLRAQLRLAAATWDRWKVLVAKGVFSRQEGDQQEANYRVAEANVLAGESMVQSNRENLSRLKVLQQYERVTAPFSGVVTARSVDVGTLINTNGSGAAGASSTSSPGASALGAEGNNQGSSGNLSSNVSSSTGGAQGGEMFTIASVNPLRILVSVPEAYTTNISVGQNADLSFQERPSDQIKGRVTRTSASINQNTRTLLVEVQVKNDGRLVPGMYVVVNFRSVQEKPPLIVPGNAIVVRGAKTVVAVIDNQVVRFRPITVGRDYGEQTEVTSGLNEGDVIALQISDEIREGAKVDPHFNNTGEPQTGGQSDSKPTQDGSYGTQGLADQPQSKGKGGGGQKSSSRSSNASK